MAAAAGAALQVQKVRTALLDAVTRGRARVQPAKVRPGRAAPDAELLLRKTSGLAVEELQYQTEEGPQGWVPLTVIRPATSATTTAAAGSTRAAASSTQQLLPTVVFLHATGSNRAAMAGRQAEYARGGYLTAAIDCRYHGERAQDSPDPRGCYQQALVRAWRGGSERPFLLDNVWDVLHLLDYLQARPDVDGRRIGMTGVSLGGMHTWLAAVADERVAVAAPMIGVQGFQWALDNLQYQARVDSIPLVFAAAAQDLKRACNEDGNTGILSPMSAPASEGASGGGAAVDAEVVAAVWRRIMPGLLEVYDAPASLPTLAPRPLLVANGEADPRCPLPGVVEAVEAARAAYEAAGAGDRLCLFADPGVGHKATPAMDAEIRAWMDRWLLLPGSGGVGGFGGSGRQPDVRYCH